MSKLTIEFTTENESGEEVTHKLPAKHAVCGRCEGHGTHLNPSIGEHAYSAEEFRESFDEEEQQEYFTRGGRYDVQCEVCEGKRVVPVVDKDACDAKLYEQYMKHMEDEASFRELQAAERSMGA